MPPDCYDLDDSDNVCFLCENPRYTQTFEVTHFGFPFRFQRCQCGVEKQTPMPNERFFEWFFNSETFFRSESTETKEIWGAYDYFKDEDCRLATARFRYRKMSDIFEARKPLDIMKIGPGSGTFLKVANDHGHNAIGCDISERFVAHARDNYGVRIDTGRFEKKDYDDEQFDVILLLNVVENVPNLAELLTAIHRTLKRGGKFIMNFVPMDRNAIAFLQKDKYFAYRPPMCYMFTHAAMDRTLEKFGFRPQRRFRDIRYVHTEKITTLMRWRRLHNVARAAHVERIPFPIYAYPSRVIISERL